jgi:hypothetical protein
MSGPLGSQQWMYSTGFYPYEIDQSLRFNDDDSAYLTRTPSTASNRKTWTWSGWVKRGNLGTDQGLFAAGATGTDWFAIGFRSTNFLHVTQNVSGSYLIDIRTPALYRDNSSWYHVLIQVDTTQATSSDRVKLYVNGVQLTSLLNYSGGSPAYPSQNFDTRINSTVVNTVGSAYNGSPMWLCDGYMAEVNFIDGQALDPTSFGEFKSGVWIPKSYSGSYGTNGFYLDFGNSGSLGADSSGNGNNWTPNNLAATDQVPDSPTNNFATLNPLEAGNGTYAEGNLKFSANTASVHQMTSSTASISSGKWYAEIFIQALGGTYPHIGITPVATSNATYVANNGYGYRSDGNKQALAASAESYGASYTTGDIIGIAFDADSGSITFYKNGSSQGVAYSSIDTSTTWRFSNSLYSTGGISIANFGQDSSFAGQKTAQGNTDANGIGDFYYAPPSGYLALCTANLPDPAIDPAQDDVPADYFNTSLWAGNSSTQTISGMGFQPDFAWIKGRNVAYDHALLDAVRGGDLYLRSSTTAAEVNYGAGLGVAFNSDGYDLGSAGAINQSGYNYVGWNWLAGNGTSSNTDGTITSTVSVNQKAGFSIVKVDSLPASTLSTFGHGLGVKPDMIILKSRNNTTNWEVYHTSLTPDGERKLYLNDTSAEIDSGFMGDTPPTSSVISFNPGGSTSNHIAYCFHSVEGYSKFGSYTGNASSDGPFVYTGFRPAFLIVKRTDSTGGWSMNDSTRDPTNLVTQYFDVQSSAAEGSATFFDFNSNGFKARDGAIQNVSGATYIYMAFAEMPFKYSNAR